MKNKVGRYSGFIRPITYLIDFAIVTMLYFYIIPTASFESIYPVLIPFAWFIIAAIVGFYEVYRFTKVISILEKAFKQTFLFSLFCLVLEKKFSLNFSTNQTLFYAVIAVGLIFVFKLLVYYFLRKYRVLFGGNFRNVILIGSDSKINPLKQFFTEHPDYGYQLQKTFDLKNEKLDLKTCLDFVLNKKVDELYCSLSDLSENQVEEIIYFADNNLKTVKFIPDEKQLFSRNYVLEYYDYIPLIPLRTIVLEKPLNKIIKRVFDLFFSLFIIVGLLSWLIPILAIIIKLDSKGPLFFKQKRHGLNNEEFDCYKFRSMQVNKEADQDLASKNDVRITKIGSFLRKSSIDELPQFFNVLLGNMSVVGPRPHMISISNVYALKIDKFMVRHFVKPGITGLAQTKGFRGEVETDSDIINRVKYDIFYMENWSLLLDLKIIFNTIFNVLKGDEKAY